MTPGGGFCGLFQPAGTASALPLPAARSSDGALQVAAWPAQGLARGIAMADAEGMAFHGELHNRAELCRQLALPEATPLPRLLRAGWQHGAETWLPRLDGVFALALRDGNALVLYRDPSGLGPLYTHTAHGGQIAFATHLDTLLRLPGVERRLARRSLHEYLRFLDISAPNTLYEGVVAVEPGQLLRWSAAGVETRSCPTPGNDEAPAASFAQAVEMLDAHLQRSVQARLADAGPAAAFLSGGVDSTLLCALAARCRPDTTAVTVGFEGAAYDETPVAQRIAAHLGLRHEVLRFGRRDYLSAFERLGRQLEQPMADPATPATLLAFEHCASRFDTVLDGTGADEAVGMMPPRHVRLAVAYASLLPHGLRCRLTGVLRAAPRLAGHAPLFDFEHPADTMIRWNGFTRREIEALCGEPVSFEHTRFYRTFSGHPRGAHFERYSALVSGMPSDRLSQAALVSGLSVRYPFCDPQTDRFLRQLRTEYRYLPGQPKRILRALLARYVPTPRWDGPKHGFNFPLSDFLAAQDYLVVRRYLDVERWRRLELLSPGKVQHYAQRFMAGDRSLMFRVWSLVILGAWMESHDELH